MEYLNCPPTPTEVILGQYFIFGFVVWCAYTIGKNYGNDKDINGG